jgi:3-oxoacyl-[acyl-carrier-protein] synthase I
MVGAPQDDDAIAVTARGMVCSLGDDVVTSCAAARAGIVRSAELDCLEVRSPEDGRTENVVGHPIPDLTLGFEGFGRLLRLTQLGLLDLSRQVSGVRFDDPHTGFYLALPPRNRHLTASDLVQDEDARRTLQEEASEQAAEAPRDEALAQRLLLAASRVLGWPGAPVLSFEARSGHTGMAEALDRAQQDLRAGRVRAAVVGGVDSLVEEDTLAWLDLTGRLKSAKTPAGLQPGEAAAFVLLERVAKAETRGASILGLIETVGHAEEPSPLVSGQAPTGAGIATVLAQLATLGWGTDPPAWVITDQNGEPYRARDWGTALVRLLARHPGLAHTVLWYPAATLGDTGAATGAVSLCLALGAFARHYAPATTTAILSCADGKSRSAIFARRRTGKPGASP